MSNKKTVVLGASEKPDRYSNMAVRRLDDKGYEVVAIGNRKGMVGNIPVLAEKIMVSDVDTITLYLNAGNQIPYYDYILSLQPRRIIFNPGAENEELKAKAEAAGINCMYACTLVLLSTGQY